MRGSFFTEDLSEMGRKKSICFDFTVFHWAATMKQNKQKYFDRKGRNSRKKKWSTAVFYPKKGGSVVLFPF